jgi:NTE family protein
VRTLLRGVGVGGDGGDRRGGAALASYLLFEPGYTRELIRLGMTDTLARRDEVLDFFGWPRRGLPPSEQDPSPTAWGDALRIDA